MKRNNRECKGILIGPQWPSFSRCRDSVAVFFSLRESRRRLRVKFHAGWQADDLTFPINTEVYFTVFLIGSYIESPAPNCQPSTVRLAPLGCMAARRRFSERAPIAVQLLVLRDTERLHESLPVIGRTGVRTDSSARSISFALRCGTRNLVEASLILAPIGRRNALLS